MKQGEKRMGIVLGIVIAAAFIGGLCCILQKWEK